MQAASNDNAFSGAMTKEMHDLWAMGQHVPVNSQTSVPLRTHRELLFLPDRAMRLDSRILQIALRLGVSVCHSPCSPPHVCLVRLRGGYPLTTRSIPVN